MIWSNDKKPIAVIWLYPSRGSFVTNVKEHTPFGDNPSLLSEGTWLRSGDQLGFVLKDRELEGVPIFGGSVAVRCTCSLSRFPDLDTTQMNVWSVRSSQVLNDALAQAAKVDPKGFLRKFMELEARVEADKRKKCLQKKKKRLPGKR